MIDYKDINIMYDLIKEFPQKKFVIRIPIDAQIDFNELRMFNKKVNIVVALEDLTKSSLYVQDNIKFYWAYPITSYYELRSIINLGASEVLLGAPLYFDLAFVSSQKVNIRLIANECFENYIPRKDGVAGTYVRPEDIKYYEPYVTTLEFKVDSLPKEATLLEIYKRGSWNGNLNLLLVNLKCDVDNRAIPDEFATARIQCRQNCMRNGSCHFCETAIKFSNTLKRNKNNIIDNNIKK